MPASDVRRINGIEITGTPSVGDVPTATSATAATWQSAGAGVLTGAVILAPATSARNVITSTANGATELTIRAKSGQTASLQEWQPSASTPLVVIDRIATGNVLSASASGGGTALLGQHLVGSGYGVTGAVDEGTGVTGSVANVAAGSSSVGVLGAAYGAATAVKASALGTGPGLSAESDGGNAGKFRSSSSLNTAATVLIQQRGSSTAHLLDLVNNGGSVLSYFDSLGAFHGTVTVSTNYAALWSSGSVTYYATLTLAQAAAVSGDTIVVAAGTFNEGGLGANGVNWWFMPGAKVTCTGTADAIFTDGGSAMTFTIGGFGEFSYGGSAGSNRCAIYQGSTSSDIKVACASISSSVWHGVKQEGGTLSILANLIRMTGSVSSGGLYLGSSSSAVQEVVVDRIEGGNPTAIDCEAGIQSIQVAHITGTKDIKCGGGSQSITFSHLDQSGIQTATFHCTGGVQAVVGARVTGASGPILLCAGGTQRADITLLPTNYSDATNAAVTCTSGTQSVRTHAASNSGAGSVANCTGGAQTLLGGAYSTSSASGYAVTGSGGTQTLSDVRAENTGTNGVAVNLAGQTIVVNGSLSAISHSGATDSITAGSAQTINNLGTICGNKAFNANVTINVSTALYPSDANVT